MASNLPPGVSESMIPGNRPDDVAEEEFWDKLDSQFQEKHPDGFETIKSIIYNDNITPESSETIMAYIVMARDLGYTAGYGQGQADRDLEIAAREMDREERSR